MRWLELPPLEERRKLWVRKPRLVLSTPAAEWEPKQSKSVALVLMSWQRCYWRTNNGLASYFGSYIHSFGGDCKAHKTILSEIRTPPWSQKTAVTRHPRKRRHRFGKSGNNIKIRRYRDTRYEIRPPPPRLKLSCISYLRIFVSQLPFLVRRATHRSPLHYYT